MSTSMPDSLEKPADIVDYLFECFRLKGADHYGESVTMASHMLQAACMAEADGHSNEMIAACLLHDFGHLVHDFGQDIAEHGVDAKHEDLGAEVLNQWFPDSVVEPAKMHVDAKRYLCTTDADYLAGLSEASKLSLELQGGIMTSEEVAAFESSPYLRDAIILRRYDDLGKRTDMETPDLEHFRELLEGLVKTGV